MSIMNFLSSLLYTPVVHTVSLDDINAKLDNYQKTLESQGFKATRADQMFSFTPTVTLTAIRENITVEVAADVAGYEGFSYALKNNWFSDEVSIRLYGFDQILTMIGATNASIPAQEKNSPEIAA